MFKVKIFTQKPGQTDEEFTTAINDEIINLMKTEIAYNFTASVTYNSSDFLTTLINYQID